MQLLIDPRVDKFLKKLPKTESNKATEYIELFKEYGFQLNEKYLKKIYTNLWELRPGTIRLFLTKIKPNVIIIHAMQKKSQQITKATITTLKAKIKEYYGD